MSPDSTMGMPVCSGLVKNPRVSSGFGAEARAHANGGEEAAGHPGGRDHPESGDRSAGLQAQETRVPAVASTSPRGEASPITRRRRL
jgi:hypothetical protein